MRTVLVVSTRLTSARRAAFEGLVGSEGRLEFADPVSGRAWTDRADVDAVVFDGPGASARQGAVPPEMTAVAIGCGIDGARPTDALPLGEIVACVCNPEHPLTARVDTEFPLVDAFAPIDVSDDSFTPVLTVGYRFLDRPVVVVNGRIVVSGVGNTDEALADPRLVTVLRRALRARHAPAGGPLGVGVVGYGPYGGMGFIHGTAVAGTPGLDLVAACDRDADRRKEAEQDFAGVRAT